MADTDVVTGQRIYPSNNGSSGEALARDHEIYLRSAINLADFVADGGDLSTSAGSLEVTLDPLRTYIDGRQAFDTSQGPYTFNLPANETRYIMVDRAGRLFHRTTNNPASGTEIVLWEVITDGTGVTSKTSLRRLNPFKELGIDDDEFLYLSSDRTAYLKFLSASGKIEVAGSLKLLNDLDANGQKLTGLAAPSADNDATRRVYVTDNFVQKAVAATITAVHTFNPGSATAPFILGANGQGQLVTGLNADQVDDLQASQFLRSDTTDQVDGVLTYAAAPLLNNTIALQGKTAGGTARNLVRMDSGDAVEIGHTSHTLELLGNGTTGLTYNSATVWTSANDGPGTGLDADTVDGIQGADIIKRDGSVAFTGTIDAGSNRLINLAAPVNPNDAARKVDIDSVVQGLDEKKSVRVATTANITLSGTQTIDGVSLSVDERVLVKNQSTGSQNGLYLVKSGTWVRTTDADEDSEVTPGMFVFVEEGTTNADSGWVLTTDGTIVVGTTALTFVQFSGAGQVVAGAGLSKTGNQLDVNVDGITIEISGDALRLKDLGISTAKLAANVVTNAKMATMAQATVKGRASGAGTGDPVDLTASQLVEIVKLADGTGSGLNADLLDGNHASAFAVVGHNHNSTYYTKAESDDIANAYRQMVAHSGKLWTGTFVGGGTNRAVIGRELGSSGSNLQPSMQPGSVSGTEGAIGMPNGTVMEIVGRCHYLSLAGQTGITTALAFSSTTPSTHIRVYGGGHSTQPRQHRFEYTDQSGVLQDALLFTATTDEAFWLQIIITLQGDESSTLRNCSIVIRKNGSQVGSFSARIAVHGHTPESYSPGNGIRWIAPLTGQITLP